MIKVLRISGYQLNVQGGKIVRPTHIFQGIKYENDYSATIGKEVGSVFVNPDVVNVPDDPIGKDLCIEYGYKGRVVKCLIQ